MQQYGYRKGFISFHYDLAPVVLPPGWSSRMIGRWVLALHPQTRMEVRRYRPGITLALIGDAFVAHEGWTMESALAAIASGDPTPLDVLSGKFAIIVYSRQGTKVIQDPIGSQTVFYSTGNRVAGSHAAMVADAVGAKRSRAVRAFMAMDEYKNLNTRYLPGDLTVFDGVVLLTPNNVLDIETQRTERYWPRGPIAPSSAAEAEQVWREYFSAYSAFLHSRYTPVLGLTGGVDSRSAIASLRAHDLPMSYVTWDNVSGAERETIEASVEHLGGTHDWVDPQHRPDDPIFEDTVQDAKAAAGFARGTPLLPALTAWGRDSTDLFVFGHGSGIMRGSWSLAAKPWLPLDPLKRAYALYAGPARLSGSPQYRDFILDAFRGFLRRGNYDAELHGVDLGVLMYWESRMANWAALQIASFDAVMNAHAALNSRRLYETFWGIEDEYRYSKDLNRDIMRSYDPILASIP